MVSNLIQVGAFLRSGTTFDDVYLGAGDPPTDFTAGDVPTFPLNFINNTTPSSWGVTGTGGTDAINKVFKLEIASTPSLEVIDNTIQAIGINSTSLSVRLKKIIRGWTSDFVFPDAQLVDASNDNYERQWTDLQRVNFNSLYVWFLHTHFAAKGYIKSDPEIFKGQGWDSIHNMTFAFDHFYVVRFESNLRFYERLR
jgi:hypothetical protein